MAEYIEREALLKWALDSMDAQRDVVGKAYCAEFVRAIRQFKAADVAPVVHGRWIVTKEYNDVIDMYVVKYTCSVCEEYRLTATGLSQATNYCPNCGARMDGE